MDSASYLFVAFGLAAALLSNFSRAPRWRSSVLFAASVFFLGTLAGKPIFLVPLAGFLLLGYAGLLLLERGWSRSMVWTILAVILVYVWLKKYAFLPEGVFVHAPYFTIGLSYIFFRVLQLLIESGDRAEKQHIGPFAYALFMLNFTTLVSGPIQRYDDFARDQFAEQPLPLGVREIGLQLERIVRGFFKVNVLAMVLDMAREDAQMQIFQPMPATLRMFAALKLIAVYPLFLYANFSGYIDIVIALARLMRVRLPENFDRPFAACSYLDFWSRWHMTLSNWFKTFVYNPLLLLLMRHISSVTVEAYLGVFCFFVTFFLVGVWHGRSSEFIFYGLLQGGGISLNKLWQVMLARRLGRKRYKALATQPLYTALARGLTFSWFTLTLPWLWSNWSQIHLLYGALGGRRWLGIWMAIWLMAGAGLAAWEWLRAALLSIRTADGPVLTSRYVRVAYSSALGLAAVVITFLLQQAAPGIVYKQF